MTDRLNTARLGTALRQAMADLDMGTKAGTYRSVGATWHYADEDGTCEVCLAGACFGRFGVTPDEGIGPCTLLGEKRIDEAEYRMLMALHMLQFGRVVDALHRLRGAQGGTEEEVERARGIELSMEQEDDRIRWKDPEFDYSELREWGQGPTRAWYNTMAEHLEAATL